MKTIFICALAATLAASGFSPGARGDANAKNLLQPKGPDLQQIGGSLVDDSAAQDIRGLLTKTVNDAATEGRFQNLVEDLAKVDRDRLGDFQHEKMEQLNKAVAQFRTDFKARYNQDFDIRPEHFKNAVIYAGRDKNSATVMLPDWMFNRKADANHAAADPLNPGAKPIPDLAKVGVSLTLNLVNEGKNQGAWRINIPSEISADQLRGNLIKRLQMLDDQKSNWPADPNATCRAAAFQILSALNDSSLALND